MSLKHNMFTQGIGYNFDFKLSYKYLKKSDAHLRYGNSTFQTWRGQMITGSYCDRILDQCDRKLCRVQSPNFPGAYPRNVTCYYRIEQRTAPKSKRALIVVRQPNAHKIHIKDQVINYDRSQRTLRYVLSLCDKMYVFPKSSIKNRFIQALLRKNKKGS